MEDFDFNEDINIVFNFLFENDETYYLMEDIVQNTFLEPSPARKAVSCLLDCNLASVRINKTNNKREYSANKYIKLNDWIYAVDSGVDIGLLEKHVLLKNNENNETFILNLNNGDYDFFKKEKEEKKKSLHKEYLKDKAMNQYIVKEIERLYKITNETLVNYTNKKEKTAKDKMLIAALKVSKEDIKNTLNSIIEKYSSIEGE